MQLFFEVSRGRDAFGGTLVDRELVHLRMFPNPAPNWDIYAPLFLQDDSFTESFISTIGVDFVSRALGLFLDVMIDYAML